MIAVTMPGMTSGDGFDRVLYDGSCGLCHWSVRFAARRDAAGIRFRFAPLAGATGRRLLTEAERRALPDSIVVLTREGRLLVESEAVLHVLRRIGGPWGLLGQLGRLVPRRLGDAAYRLVARSRRRLWRAPEAACPLLPPALRDRFDD